MKLLELFSGTGVLSKTFRSAGYETLTLDIDPYFNADLQISIFDVDIKKLKKFNPDIIWASPPCHTFSVMALSHYWHNCKPKQAETYIGMARVMRAIEIIRELKPKYWFLENPVGMLRKQFFMKNLHKKTVTYCKYGETYRKPTDIWTNAYHWIPRKICKPGDRCHEEARRGERLGGLQGVTNQSDQVHKSRRAKLPVKLCEEILKVCEGKTKNIQTMLIK